MTYLGDTDPEAALAPLQQVACTYRIALGPRAGQKVLTLQTLPNQAAVSTLQRCVNEQGFSLHAEVRLAINQRHKLEHLCRYITRPALANERLILNRAGEVVLQLKSPYHDGTTPIRDVTPGVHAATRRAGSPAAVASDPLPWRARAPRQAACRDHSQRPGQRH
jgi:hypothetical protein